MSLTHVREARGKISILPRWIHHAYALIGGYFWLPCSLCGRNVGGHEWRSVNGRSSTIPSERAGIHAGICPVCTYQGRGSDS